MRQTLDCQTPFVMFVVESCIELREDPRKTSVSTAKKYENCIHRPVFARDDDTIILDVIPPPELHLMLGVVNTIFNHIATEFEETAFTWAKLCNVERDVTNGGTGFNGNSCKSLLNKTDILRSICPLSCLKYVQVLDDFHSVVKACFGQVLDDEFQTHIDKFKKSFLDLEVSVTPKVHAIFFHVPQFCSKRQESLGFYSEQAMEAVHFEFKIFWNKHKVHDSHPSYPQKLLKTVCEFNAFHI